MNQTTILSPFSTDIFEGSAYLIDTLGFFLFPMELVTTIDAQGLAHLGKKPLVKWKDVSTNNVDILHGMLKRFQQQGKNPQIGIDCAKSGIFVLDVDVRNGAKGLESLAQLEEKYEKLPQTLLAKTPSGGLHYYFRGHGANSASSPLVGVNLDTRGDGGLIVCPPSVADTGECYCWINPPDCVEMADAPQWLIDLSAASKHTKDATPKMTSKTDTVCEGGRNAYLTSRGGELRALGLEEEDIFGALFVRNVQECTPPLDQSEVYAIVQSLMRYESNEKFIQKQKDITLLAHVEAKGRAFQQQTAVQPEPAVVPPNPSLVDELPPVPPIYEKSFGSNDTGNAERVLDRFGWDILHVSPKGFGWYVWDMSRWKADVLDKHVMQFAKESAFHITEDIKKICPPVDDKDKARYDQEVESVLRWANKSQDRPRLSAALDLAAVEHRVSRTFMDLDTHPTLFNVKNGVVDLTTGELKEAKRELLLTQLCPTSYHPDAPCPNWLAFLEKIFLSDPAMMRYAQYIAGQFLVGHNASQVMYFFHGGGQNGKSTFLEAIHQVLGNDFSMMMDFGLLKQSENEKSVRNDLAEMLGKRLIAISESNRGDTLAEGFVKRATGETTVRAEKKYGAPFNIPLTFTMCLMTQNLPRIVGQDKGMWRRLRLLPFNYTITDDERDNKFIEHNLRKEFPGILRWMVEGSLLNQDIRENDIIPPACVDALREYKEETDHFSQFVTSCLDIVVGGFISNEELFAIAADWGQKNRAPALCSGGTSAFSQMFEHCELTQSLVKHSRKNVNGKKVSGYHGVRLAKASVIRNIAKTGDVSALIASRN